MSRGKFKPREITLIDRLTPTDGLNEFSQYVKEHFAEEQWIFRGMLSTYDLRTSIERAFKKWEIPLEDYYQTEGELIRDFQRRFILAKDYKPPHTDDILAWLALMQHYGAPTRLMDWTYSPFIAAFFAAEMYLKSMNNQKTLIEENEENPSAIAIWAIRRKWCDVAASSTVSKDLLAKLKLNETSAFNELFMSDSPRHTFVYPVIPYDLNERLVIQQGVFICPSDLTKAFETNLMNMNGCQEASNIIKILIPIDTTDKLNQIFMDLYRMNIYRASLFPGIDSYAHSFKTRLPLLHILSKTHTL